MASSATFIRSILQKLLENRNESLVHDFENLPLRFAPKQQTDTLISKCLSFALKKGNIAGARIVVDTFNEARREVEGMTAITALFLNPFVDRQMMSFVIAAFPEKSGVDFLVDLANIRNEPLACEAAEVIISFFPRLSIEDWKFLAEFTKDLGDGHLYKFFQRKLGYVPDYIGKYPRETLENVPTNIPSVREAVELIMKDMCKSKIRIPHSGQENPTEGEKQENSLEQLLISQYAISTIAEKIQMLSPIVKIPPFDDRAVFREFGPVNTMYTLNPSLFDPNHECTKYGGCRMFLCREFESPHPDEEEEEGSAEDLAESPLPDWFNGRCDKCEEEILHRHFSIRQPLVGGGWSGCYCSFECVRVDNPYEALMVGRIKEQLQVIGISDIPSPLDS